MSSDGSVTHWIDQIKEGDSDAAGKIWERYFPQLVRLARQKLQGVPRGMADEEDVAQSAMKSFCVAAQRNRFPDLADRHDLWRLLLRMTARKAISLARHERRQRRGGGRVRGDSALNPADVPSAERGWAQVVGDAPTPEFAAIMAEECQRLLGLLQDPEHPHLVPIAVAKLEGYVNREIAQKLGCSKRTVERGLDLIRKRWKGEQPP